MTYLTFLALFVVLPIALLLRPARHAARRLGPRGRWSLPALAALALVYTTPWDNYLVWRGVWAYGPDRVLATIGWVPVEEYLFFLLQPFLTGLLLYALLGRRHEPPTRDDRPARIVTLLPAAAWLLGAVAGARLLAFERTTYLGLILVWACPVLAGQWLYAAASIRRLGGTAALAVALPTLYLWTADRAAIALGIWSISERFTTGAHVAGLPIEEAVFFLLTNVLIVQGVVLFLFPDRRTAT